jgi:hypothetical protein
MRHVGAPLMGSAIDGDDHRLEGLEVIAVVADRAAPKPSYIDWLEWRDDRIIFIRDYRCVRYVTAEAELMLAHETEPGDDGRSVMCGAVLLDHMEDNGRGHCLRMDRRNYGVGR